MIWAFIIPVLLYMFTIERQFEVIIYSPKGDADLPIKVLFMIHNIAALFMIFAIIFIPLQLQLLAWFAFTFMAFVGMYVYSGWANNIKNG